MRDQFGRTIDYVRISLTDQCNLRCIYCMPKEGVMCEREGENLKNDEILRLTKVFAELGLEKIKLTGGEPLLKKELPSLVKDMKNIHGIKKVTLTTNGILLKERMEELSKAGIDGINVSLDTLNQKVFEEITRRKGFDRVMEGLQEALQYPEIPLKINCVPMKIPGQDVLKLAEIPRKYPVLVRYIEMMPIGLGRGFEMEEEDALLSKLAKRYGSYEEVKERLGNGPCRYVRFPGFVSYIGFVSAMSHPFCASCNRVRLTSSGFLKTCLQYDVGRDLKPLLRGGASEEELKRAIQETIFQKPRSHDFQKQQEEHLETRMMSEIGG